MTNRTAAFLLLIGIVHAGSSAYGGESILPRETVLLIRTGSLTRTYGQLKTLDGVQAMRKSPMAHPLGDAVTGLAGLLSTHFLGVAPSRLLETLGGDASLALLDKTDAKGRAEWAVICDLADAANDFGILWTKTILPRLREALPPSSLSTTLIGGHRAHRIAAKGGGVYVLRVKRYLLAGSKPAIQECLDTMEGRSSALRALPRVDGPLTSGAGLAAWMDVERLRLRGVQSAWERKWQKQEMEKVGLLDVSSVTATSTVREGILEERIALQIMKARRGLLGLIAELKPCVINAPEVIPGDFQCYLAMAFKDGDDLGSKIEDLARRMGGQQGVDNYHAGRQSMEEKLHVDLHRDFFEALGNHAFVAFHGLDLATLLRKGTMKSPQNLRFVLGFHSVAPDRILGAVDNVAAEIDGVQLKVQKIEGYEVHSLSHPNAPTIAPSCARVGDYVLFAVAEETLISALQAIAAGETLNKESSFRHLAGETRPAAMALYLRLQPQLNTVLEATRSRAPKRLRPFWPYLMTAARSLPAVYFDVGATPQRVTFRLRSSLGAVTLPGALIVAARLLKTENGRRVEDTRDRMKKVVGGIRKYVRQEKAFPPSLDFLVPHYVEALPPDPFAGPDGHKFGYVSFGRPGQEGAGWLLISRGPDRKRDVPDEIGDFGDWLAQYESPTSPAAAGRLKRQIYRFRPDSYADERSDEDEGDIVNVSRR